MRACSLGRLVVPVVALALAACSGGGTTSAPAPQAAAAATSSTVVIYEGARLIAGDNTPAIENGAFVVDGDRITAIGRKGEVTAPAGAAHVDLTGKTVMPAIIGAHGHVGYQKGVTFLRENYTRENIMNDLARAAYFGIGTAMTMGIDTPQYVYDIREATANGLAGVARLRTAGTGMGGPNAGPGNLIYARGVAFELVTEADGRKAVDEVAPHHPDLVKIWLDDRGGRGKKVTPPVVRAVVDEAAKQNLRVIAHVRNHDDAEVAVGAGVYALSHLARDKEMSDALVADIVKKGVYVTPTLSMAERNNYSGDVPAWFKEPRLLGLLSDSITPDMLDHVKLSFIERKPKDAEEARTSYQVLKNTVKKLNTAGARLVLGCDTGLPDHFWGLAEHREMELLVEAGMTPAQVLVAATSRAAEFLSLKDLGTLAPGKIADFLVLDANPLDDIRNTRSIASLYMQGRQVDRAAIKARLQAVR